MVRVCINRDAQCVPIFLCVEVSRFGIAVARVVAQEGVAGMLGVKGEPMKS